VVAVAGVAGFVIGGIVPEYGLRSLVNRRRRRMSAALPDALDLMTMCLESGLTFERALATVADELSPIEPDLAVEFRQIEAELRVGADRRSVLQAYHGRTEIEGLRDFAMSLIQGDRYGTPLAQSMKNIAAGERGQRAARIEAWAGRLPVLMSLPMLLLVIPGTLLLIAGPAFMVAMQALGGFGELGAPPGGE
jgi:tight adherence protein C